MGHKEEPWWVRYLSYWAQLSQVLNTNLMIFLVFGCKKGTHGTRAAFPSKRSAFGLRITPDGINIITKKGGKEEHTCWSHIHDEHEMVQPCFHNENVRKKACVILSLHVNEKQPQLIMSHHFTHVSFSSFYLFLYLYFHDFTYPKSVSYIKAWMSMMAIMHHMQCMCAKWRSCITCISCMPCMLCTHTLAFAWEQIYKEGKGSRKGKLEKKRIVDEPHSREIP